jgi:hypothetical protein
MKVDQNRHDFAGRQLWFWARLVTMTQEPMAGPSGDRFDKIIDIAE